MRVRVRFYFEISFLKVQGIKWHDYKLTAHIKIKSCKANTTPIKKSHKYRNAEFSGKLGKCVDVLTKAVFLLKSD